MKTKKLNSLDQQALQKIEEKRIFNSPTWGSMTFKEVIFRLGEFMLEDSNSAYDIIIGTDSHAYRHNDVTFVSAIIIHRFGGGALYFWEKTQDIKNHYVLKTRMYEEAVRSINLAKQFMDEFQVEGITKFNVEIHVDIGKKGKTRDVINEVIGMIEANGFVAKTKPAAYGAASVADRHTWYC